MSSLLQQKRQARSHQLKKTSTRIHTKSSGRWLRQRSESSSPSVSANTAKPFSLILKVLSLIPFIALIGWLIYGPWLRIATIECQEAQGKTCHPAVQAEFNQLVGEHLFQANFTATKDKVRAAYPLYQHFSIQRQLPRTIIITVEETPIAYTIQYSSEKYNVNEDGILTPWQDSSQQLPLLTFTENTTLSLDPQTPLTSDLHQGLLHLHQSLKKSVFANDRVTIRSLEEIIITTKQGKELILKTDNIQNQLSVAEEVVDYPLDQEWYVADLRFNKPVLTTSLNVNTEQATESASVE